MSHVITAAEYGHCPRRNLQVTLCVIFLYILLAIVLLLSWPLLSTVIVRLDTSLPQLMIRWKTLCTLRATYDQDAITLEIRTPLFHRTWSPATRQDRRRPTQRPQKKHKKRPAFTRIVRALKACRVDAFHLAVDTDDAVLNAWLYPLNYISLPAGRTIRINFENDSYLRLQISARPWHLVAAWIFG